MRKKHSLLTWSLVVFFLTAFLFFYLYLIKGKKTQEKEGVIHDYKRPGFNVILISVDTLRADHLSCYGYKRNTSPSIDRFSENSIVFDRAIAQAPVTLPSHMSMLTSLYSYNHGVISFENKLSDSIITLPDILHRKGYKTVAFTDAGYVSSEYNYHTFDIFDDSSVKTDEKFEIMISWLEENSNQKFFLFWHTMKVHSPYTPQEKYDIFSDKEHSGIVDVYPNPEEPICKGLGPGCTFKHTTFFKKIMEYMTQKDLEYIRSKYDGEILHVDDQFRTLLKILKKKGIRNKTIIILTSDHGESFADRENLKKIGHDLMYNEVTQVPLIINIPGISRQIRVKNTVESIDIMPTVLDILDIEIPQGLDGQSLFKVIFNPEIEETAYCERIRWGFYMIERGKKKLIYYQKKNIFEFYDLEKDPHERNNIFNDKDPIQLKMKKELLSRVKDIVPPSKKIRLNKKKLEELKALGYIK